MAAMGSYQTLQVTIFNAYYRLRGFIEICRSYTRVLYAHFYLKYRQSRRNAQAAFLLHDQGRNTPHPVLYSWGRFLFPLYSKLVGFPLSAASHLAKHVSRPNIPHRGVTWPLNFWAFLARHLQILGAFRQTLNVDPVYKTRYVWLRQPFVYFLRRKETIFEVPVLSTTSAMQYSTSSRKHVRQHVKPLKFPKVLYHHRAAEQTDMRRLVIAYSHGL